MSQKVYNITDNVNETFDFFIRDKKYSMRYPTTSEMEELQTMTEEFQEARANIATTPEEMKKRSDSIQDFMYSFISPIDHETSVEEALKTENVVVLRNFNTMIKSELSIEI